MPLWLEPWDWQRRAQYGPRCALEGVEAFEIGRSPRADVPLLSGRVELRHAAARWLEGQRRWVLEAPGQTWREGNRVTRHVLSPGETFFLSPEFELRVGGTLDPVHRHPELEAALTRAWDDGTADVYADWLLSKQERLGEWMTDPVEPRHRPGARRWCASLVREGLPLQLSWRRGFVVAARVAWEGAPRPGSPMRFAAPVVTALFEHPLARFLQVLEIDVVSFLPADTPSALGAAAARIGPGLLDAIPPGAGEALAEVRFVAWPAEAPAAYDEARLRDRAPRATVHFVR